MDSTMAIQWFFHHQLSPMISLYAANAAVDNVEAVAVCYTAWGRARVMGDDATHHVDNHLTPILSLTNIDKQHQLSTPNNSGSGGAATTTTIDQSIATTISYNSHSMRLTR